MGVTVTKWLWDAGENSPIIEMRSVKVLAQNILFKFDDGISLLITIFMRYYKWQMPHVRRDRRPCTAPLLAFYCPSPPPETEKRRWRKSRKEERGEGDTLASSLGLRERAKRRRREWGMEGGSKKYSRVWVMDSRGCNPSTCYFHVLHYQRGWKKVCYARRKKEE